MRSGYWAAGGVIDRVETGLGYALAISVGGAAAWPVSRVFLLGKLDGPDLVAVPFVAPEFFEHAAWVDVDGTGAGARADYIVADAGSIGGDWLTALFM